MNNLVSHQRSSGVIVVANQRQPLGDRDKLIAALDRGAGEAVVEQGADGRDERDAACEEDDVDVPASSFASCNA